MVIGFIGAGRTGCTIGKYLSGHTAIAGYYSRTRQSTDDAAAFTQSKAFYSLEALIDSCDTVFITTPDRAISEVWECIRHYNLKDKIICHFSGSLSSGIFLGLKEQVRPVVQSILCMHPAINIHHIYNLMKHVCLSKDRILLCIR